MGVACSQVAGRKLFERLAGGFFVGCAVHGLESGGDALAGLADLNAKEIAPLVQLRSRLRLTELTPGANEADTSIIASRVVRKQPHRTLPRDKREDLLRCYRLGEPVGELCKRFGISRNYLNQIRKAAGVDGGVWVFRTVCFERVVLSSPGCLWPGRMDDHEEVLEAHA